MDKATKSLLELVDASGRNVAVRLASEAGISRQAASTRLRAAIQNNLIVMQGVGRGVEYRLATSTEFVRHFERAHLSEDHVWRQTIAPVMADLPENVRSIWQYGITEMVNNAIDHSGGASIAVGIRRNALHTEAWVADDGDGIFVKIQKALDLFDPREAILELAKGKFTTDPLNHTGEGIFFSSRMFDGYEIRSGNLRFFHDSEQDDWLIEQPENTPGTLVGMRLANDAARTSKEIFDKFAAPDEYTFAETIVPVRLGQYEGEALVSRSQAKRLIFRFEKFKTVILDFTGIAEIGQAFSDEVFRVFQKAHPETKLVPINMTAAVNRMVARARAA
ncbi:MAG: STAS-like domain-containing protein [Methylobacillus sp.]|jgi:anti-sigma regulatory factor (Ser/Thr protein kinase)|nr:STAS-like domain-containing protein [Methylobacillus sp.]